MAEVAGGAAHGRGGEAGEAAGLGDADLDQAGSSAVLNVACVPVPDPVLGERMCACVLLRPGWRLTLPELTEFLLAEEMAKHKLPEQLATLDALPL